jgi:hypothetical protein
VIIEGAMLLLLAVAANGAAVGKRGRPEVEVVLEDDFLWLGGLNRKPMAGGRRRKRLRIDGDEAKRQAEEKKKLLAIERQLAAERAALERERVANQSSGWASVMAVSGVAVCFCVGVFVVAGIICARKTRKPKIADREDAERPLLGP